MDIQGVLQHHDAVTGTEKKHVLENYNYVLYRQIQQNTDNYAEMVNEIAKERGIQRSKLWEWCARSNGTYLDCPIANYEKE